MRSILYLNKDAFLGGSAISLLLLLKNIRKDYKIFVVLGADGKLKEELERLNIPVKVIKFYGWRQLKNIIRNLYALIKLKFYIKKISPDIIHSNSYEINPFMVLAAPKNINTICHIRDLISYDKAKKYLVHKSKKVIVISNAVANKLKLIKNLNIVYNGVNLSNIKREKPSLPIKVSIKGKTKVGIIGNCEERKRQEDFVKAGIEVLQKDTDFCFFIIGNIKTKYCEKLKSFIKNYEKYFCFIPFQYKIYSIIKSLDIIVITSKEEAFGRVAIEAGACNKPVVALDIGGLPEIIIHKKTGFLVPCCNYKKLAKYIMLLKENPRLKKKLGINAYNHIKNNFTHTKYINEIVKIYESS